MKPKALVFLDFDMLVRHFVMSGGLAGLERDFEVVYIVHDSGNDAKKEFTVDLKKYGRERVEPCVVPRSRMGLWYLLFVPTAFRYQRGRPGFWHRRKMFVEVIGARRVNIFSVIGLPGIYEIYKFAFKMIMGSFPAVDDILDRHRPDVVVQPSVLTGPFINELLISTKKRKIPYIVVMNSWDNPATKAVATGVPDILGVWGENSRELASKYLGIPRKNIQIMGSAQFDVYRTPPTKTMRELAQQFGVPPDRRIVLYAGSGVGRYESVYLRRLDQMTRPGGELDGCHIVYRPHPWRGELAEGEENFFSLGLRNTTMDPHMRDYYNTQVASGSAQRGMFLVDYKITNDLMALVSCVISPLSTILLEAVLNGRPVLVFAPPTNAKLAISADQPHFRDFIALADVNKCFDDVGFEAVCAKLRAQMDDVALHDRLRAHGKHYVDLSSMSFSERLAESARELVRS